MHLGIAPERAKTHFNKQPRGGGCHFGSFVRQKLKVSTLSRAEAAAPYLKKQEKSAN